MTDWTIISYLDILGFVLILLKCCGIINWSWFVVLLPILAPPIIASIIFFVVLFLWGTLGVINWFINRIN